MCIRDRCGTGFMQGALAIAWDHGDLGIKGWIVSPSAGSVSDIQYCYVNGRMMRDRLINHAIRQAYEGHLDENQQPAYVLYLTVDPQQVDVNVHPAKHEVRFHQARLVHDFIYQGVRTALLNAHQADELPGIEPVTHEVVNRTAAGDNYFAPSAVPLTIKPEREALSETEHLYSEKPRSSSSEPIGHVNRAKGGFEHTAPTYDRKACLLYTSP